MKKSILITGTSKGLGIELLKIFLDNNWNVYALARDITSFKNISSKHLDTCFPIEGDITDDTISEKIINTISKNTNCLDILINNAGNAEKCFGIKNTSPQDLENHFKVHVSGTYRIIKASLPFLTKANQANIINISSRKGSINRVDSGAYRILLPYQIAKAAQNMLTVGLNQELNDTNIKIFAIHPGNLKTDVAPPDADTEPKDGAKQIFTWINNKMQNCPNTFINISNNETLEW